MSPRRAGPGEWFVIVQDAQEHAGRPHLVGWMGSAILGNPVSPGDSGWLAYGTCPRCHAVVITEEQGAHGDQSWAHEQWHAQTDYPVPPDVLAQAAPEYQATYVRRAPGPAVPYCTCGWQRVSPLGGPWQIERRPDPACLYHGGA